MLMDYPMSAPLDLDQLKTFLAIADTGSFTRASDIVHRTQSAVSMQMRKLEERLGKPLFEKDGRTNRLTEDGERLTVYARRLVQLNNETMAAFDESRLEGHVRIGTPDDYAERFLPEIIGRFMRSNPKVELTVICEPTYNLIEEIRKGALDIALITRTDMDNAAEIVRREPLLWVSSAAHDIHLEAVLPLALGRPSCKWRERAVNVLGSMNREHKILFNSWSATVIAAAVLSGQAVSVLPECALRPGMRVLGEAEGFKSLGDAGIGILRGRTNHPALVDALASHIADSLDNLTAPAMLTGSGSFDFQGTALAKRSTRLKPGHVLAGW